MKQPVHSNRGGGYQKSFQRNGRNNDSDWANNGGGGGYGHGAGGGPGGYQNSSKHRGQDYRGGGFQQNNDSASADWSQGHNGGYQKRGSRNSYKDEFRSQNGGVSGYFNYKKVVLQPYEAILKVSKSRKLYRVFLKFSDT